jgi:hypothetical protein
MAARVGPGWAAFASAKLGTGNGCQDHTVLLYATTPLVLREKQSLTAQGRPVVAFARDTVAPAATRTPRIVTTRTPLFMRRVGVNRAAISANEKRIIFIW